MWQIWCSAHVVLRTWLARGQSELRASISMVCWASVMLRLVLWATACMNQRGMLQGTRTYVVAVDDAAS